MKRCKSLDKTLNYQKIAQSIGIEPSYLSRFLGDTDVHFSEELLFKLLKAMKLDDSKIDLILLLKEYDRTSNQDRKNFLRARMKWARVQRWRMSLKQIKEDLNELVSFMDEV